MPLQQGQQLLGQGQHRGFGRRPRAPPPGSRCGPRRPPGRPGAGRGGRFPASDPPFPPGASGRPPFARRLRRPDPPPRHRASPSRRCARCPRAALGRTRRCPRRPARRRRCSPASRGRPPKRGQSRLRSRLRNRRPTRTRPRTTPRHPGLRLRPAPRPGLRSRIAGRPPHRPASRRQHPLRRRRRRKPRRPYSLRPGRRRLRPLSVARSLRRPRRAHPFHWEKIHSWNTSFLASAKVATGSHGNESPVPASRSRLRVRASALGKRDGASGVPAIERRWSSGSRRFHPPVAEEKTLPAILFRNRAGARQRASGDAVNGAAVRPGACEACCRHCGG